MALTKEYEKDHFTYAEYEHWSSDERWEIIDGKAYNMSGGASASSKRSARPAPAPGMTHQVLSGEIFRQIANFLEGKPCKVFAAPFDVFLPELHHLRYFPTLNLIC